MYLTYTYRYRDIGAASREELKIMEIDIRRGEFMSNEADNKTPREFFRITSGLLVCYTRGSCMTRQKCPSGAHGRGENERGSPWYIVGLEKWFRRRGNRETPKCSLRFGWRRIAFPRVTDTRTRTCIHVPTDVSNRAFVAKCIFGLHASPVFASPIFIRSHLTNTRRKEVHFLVSNRDIENRKWNWIILPFNNHLFFYSIITLCPEGFSIILESLIEEKSLSSLQFSLWPCRCRKE